MRNKKKAATIPTDKYENRIVIFFDILGFKDLVNSTKNDDNSGFKKIKNILEYIKAFYKDEISRSYIRSKQITFSSDSIIISFEEIEANQLFYTLCGIQILLINLVNRGVLMRGAISFGKLFHTKDFLFGPAFIQAYESETRVANFPRIILHESILLLNHGKKSKEEFKQDLPYFFEILSIDSDALLYIDYFEKTINNTDSEEEFLNYLDSLKKLIEINLATFRSNGNWRVKRKYLWMKRKYNSALIKVREVADFKVIEEKGLTLLLNKLTLIK